MHYAALFPIRCNEIVGLVLTVLIAGAIAYFAEAIIGVIPIVKDSFKALAIRIAVVACYVWIAIALLQVVFGISLFGWHVGLVC